MLTRITNDITDEELGRYWPGFESVAFAFFDKNNVYLFNHPNYKSTDRYQTLKWDNQFKGCTLILFEEYPTAIVDLDYFADYESLYSITVHELFHGYQYIKGEKRFPDELQGVTYPLLKENVEIRCLERTNLYQAIMADTAEGRLQYMEDFITLREKRATILKEHLEYENLIETVEGPAWYLESKAYADKCAHSYAKVLEKNFTPILTDHKRSALEIRRSCMGSGLFICLLLDEIEPEWKKTFLDSEKSLYDILKRHARKWGNPTEDTINISSETEDIIDYVLRNKKKPIEDFEKQDGIHLFIEGPIEITSLDPMNISTSEGKRLHQTFIGVRIYNEEFVIQQPVVVYPRDGLKKVAKLHLILMKEPIEMDDSLIVEGIGGIKGRVTKKGNEIWLVV